MNGWVDLLKMYLLMFPRFEMELYACEELGIECSKGHYIQLGTNTIKKKFGSHY